MLAREKKESTDGKSNSKTKGADSAQAKGREKETERRGKITPQELFKEHCRLEEQQKARGPSGGGEGTLQSSLNGRGTNYLREKKECGHKSNESPGGLKA